MKYFIILLAAVATASAVAVPEAQPKSLDKRACYTAFGACRTACPNAACARGGTNTAPEFCC
ncbi:hypothetical protein COCVIDRAFT_33958 [Bipolaris victoriae FI3]|uniref:Uncharacterized protein n=1 Tax=Bipolaris victoriae (strain FI3) TaxID=930091 RepID=W7ETC5_BIPV3|nr:hypothetical protein COCVIDRAFT_33958 [Bipolaris victoriae FI3]